MRLAQYSNKDKDGCWRMYLLPRAVLGRSLVGAGSGIGPEVPSSGSSYTSGSSGGAPPWCLALYTAAKMGHSTVVRHVLAQCPGTDLSWVPHPSDPSVLHLSAACGPVGVLTALVDAGVDVNARTTAKGMTPLLALVCGGDHEQPEDVGTLEDREARVRCLLGQDHLALDPTLLGKTAEEWAWARCLPTLAAMLAEEVWCAARV